MKEKQAFHPLPGLSREAEEKQLSKIIGVAQEHLTRTEQYIRQLTDELDDLMEVYGTKDKEAMALFHNTHSQIQEYRRALLRCQKARRKPYFGRIDFKDPRQPQAESYYVGRVGISGSDAHPLVIDWRAPVASVYYENAVGPCTYTVRNEGSFAIELLRKRTYEIENDKLKDFYDSDVVANDDLLTEYLAKSKKAVLGEIIATIQKEQNAMIRQSPKTNLIVQGVAGSGKTTVAMHRISYILYNYEEQFRPQDFYIIGSNRILLNYITGVLPDLDVYGVAQMTMEELFTRLLYEDWDSSRYTIRPVDQSEQGACRKGSLSWFQDLERFCVQLEQQMIPKTDICIPKNGVLLLAGSEIQGCLFTLRQSSVQSKINMLNEILLSRLETELSGKYVTYSAVEKKELHRTYRWHFGRDVWKGSVYEIYEQFLTAQQEDNKTVPFTQGSFDVYDLAALAYLYKRIKETDAVREATHIIVDEAQDFGMMAYGALAYCMRGCTYTIMGDVSQNIHFGYGLDDWRELEELILTGTYDHFGLLKKSYRNTVEISQFAAEILRHGSFPIYPVEPISRHGAQPCVQECKSEEALLQQAVRMIKDWQEKERGTIAVICRDEKEADSVRDKLSEHIPVAECSLDTAEFGQGVMVLPVAYTKGLEFDAVLLYNPSAKSYPAQDAYVKLLYVAATRALHELAVLHLGNLTDLIARPVSKEKRMQSLENEVRKEAKRYKKEETTVREQELLKAKQGEEERTARSYLGPKPIQVQASAANSKLSPKRSAAGQTAASYSSQGQASARRSGQDRTANVHSRQGQSSAGHYRPVQPGIRRGMSAQPQTAQQAKNEAWVNPSPYRFGECPDSGALRPKGHSHMDHCVRIVKKAKTYVDMISSYGTLRLTPICDCIIRVQFQRGAAADFVPSYWDREAEETGIFTVKDGRQLTELRTGELCIHVEKKTGAVQFLDRQGRLLLAEQAALPRQMEMSDAPQGWVYFDWEKKEQLFIKGMLADELERVNQKARYISFGGKRLRMPLIVSANGYGIGAAAEGTAMCCTIPMYGSYLYTQGNGQIDYYFLYGGSREEVLKLYHRHFTERK